MTLALRCESKLNLSYALYALLLVTFFFIPFFVFVFFQSQVHFLFTFASTVGEAASASVG